MRRTWIILACMVLTLLRSALLAEPLSHWAFQPMANPALPQLNQTTWPRQAVDHFILAGLQRAELQPASEATRTAWLRRVTFDLIGLPPTPEEVVSFQNNTSADAYEQVVERLLASPRYGERWAQHWLDVVRYADTHGFEVNTERPHAWPYRDYVIRAINEDRPYDRFIREQLTGDALGEDAATGFLLTASVLLPGQIGKDAPSLRLARQDALDEIVTNISQTFLGLSVGCARCHDHKFDPISQRDYYAMQAFVAGVEYEDRELRTPALEAQKQELETLRQRIATIDLLLAAFEPLAQPKTNPLRQTVNARRNLDRFAAVTTKRVRFSVRATNSLEPCLDELEIFNTKGQNVALASGGTTITTSGDTVVTGRHEPQFIHDGRYGNSRSWMSHATGQGWVEFTFPQPEEIDRVVWSRDREGKFEDRLATSYGIEIATKEGEWTLVADDSDRWPFVAGENPKPSSPNLSAEETTEAKRLTDEKQALAAKITTTTISTLAFAGKFRTPDEIHLLNRGDPEQPGELLEPAVIKVLGELPLPKHAPELQRRQALAEWIASPQHPLTARVMVNRLWQGHFGTGLVATPNDFGRNGAKPSHPELLDWLALEFIRSGWSCKHLHRLIVLSATYRQSAAPHPEAAAQDAESRLLWRFPPRRLEAETIRDTMLAVSGALNFKMGGPGFNLFEQRGGLSGFTPVASFQGDGLRRMIYAHKIRREREAVFGAFDCPDAGQSTARRAESTTPVQSLNLFNSRFTLDAAEALAGRAQQDAGNTLESQIDRVFQLTFSRPPAPEEVIEVMPAVRAHGLATLCRALLNTNEFLFLP